MTHVVKWIAAPVLVALHCNALFNTPEFKKMSEANVSGDGLSEANVSDGLSAEEVAALELLPQLNKTIKVDGLTLHVKIDPNDMDEYDSEERVYFSIKITLDAGIRCRQVNVVLFERQELDDEYSRSKCWMMCRSLLIGEAAIKFLPYQEEILVAGISPKCKILKELSCESILPKFLKEETTCMVCFSHTNSTTRCCKQPLCIFCRAKLTISQCPNCRVYAVSTERKTRNLESIAWREEDLQEGFGHENYD
jgi:hypothetical protein